MADAIDMLKHAVYEHARAKTEYDARRWAEHIEDAEEMVRAAVWNRAPKFLRVPKTNGAA